MKTEKEVQELVKNGHKTYLPNLTIDCAIFGYHGRQLKILLEKPRKLDGFSLPRGFVGKTEPLSMAARRILKERFSLDQVFLKQFYTFGDGKFRSKNHKAIYLSKDCLMERTLSIGYYALVKYARVSVVEDILTEKYVWQDIKKIPALLFGHNELLEKALEHIRTNLYHHPIGYNLLEKKFTLPDIQSLYEIILDKKLDRRNFSKRILSLGQIRDTHEVRSIGGHRSPKLYTFDQKNAV